MPSFFDKLNTIVRAQINDLISPVDEHTSRARRKFLSRQEIDEGLQTDVQGLRKRIEEALQYEDELQAKADRLYAEIAEWDEKADAAVNAGRETDARFALGRLQQAQRELEITESALREHRAVAQELISQVNTLEAVLEQARREQPAEPPAKQHTSSTSIDVEIIEDEDEQDDDTEQGFQRRVNDNRKKLSELMADRAPTPMADQSEVVEEIPQPRHPIDQRQVDDDLAARLKRLSKPSGEPEQRDASDPPKDQS